MQCAFFLYKNNKTIFLFESSGEKKRPKVNRTFVSLEGTGCISIYSIIQLFTHVFKLREKHSISMMFDLEI